MTNIAPFTCRWCRRGANKIHGHLERVNPLGETPAEWECRPVCTRANKVEMKSKSTADLATSLEDIAAEDVLRSEPIRDLRSAATAHVLEVGDAAGFWELFRPDQALALLKAAPTRLLGPWVKEDSRWTRRAWSSDRECFVVLAIAYDDVTMSFHGEWFTYGMQDRTARERGVDRENAKAAADAALRAAGWVLVDELSLERCEACAGSRVAKAGDICDVCADNMPEARSR